MYLKFTHLLMSLSSYYGSGFAALRILQKITYAALLGNELKLK